jgi:hypothetical protein
VCTAGSMSGSGRSCSGSRSSPSSSAWPVVRPAPPLGAGGAARCGAWRRACRPMAVRRARMWRWSCPHPPSCPPDGPRGPLTGGRITQPAAREGATAGGAWTQLGHSLDTGGPKAASVDRS